MTICAELSPSWKVSVEGTAISPASELTKVTVRAVSGPSCRESVPVRIDPSRSDPGSRVSEKVATG